MKEIFKITASLTGVCIAAALILGAVYTQTVLPRKQIEERERKEIIQGLLGFGHGKEPPADLRIYPIYRYVVKSPDMGTALGYLVPVEGEGHSLVLVDLEGKPLKALEVNAKAEDLAEQGPRDKAVLDVLPKGSSATYAETFYIANKGGDRFGYVLPGITQGFKTFIKLMVSLDPELTVTGIAITESEEDPGLGAEIEQDYFRNQFVGKTLKILPGLEVIKEPLPGDYMVALESDKAKKAGMDPEEIEKIKKKYLEKDIYALTGATISSVAVLNGVKGTVRKFVYRFDILKGALKQENVQAAF